MKTNPNEPINSIKDIDRDYIHSVGLTKREYFAAMALQGLLVDPRDSEGNYIHNEIIAKMSVILADTLIVKLNEIKP